MNRGGPLESPVNWASARDLNQASLLGIVEISEQGNTSREDILTADSLVIDIDRDLAKWPGLALRVHSESHRRARSERRTQEVVGVGAMVIAAKVCGLVALESMTSKRHVVGQGSGTCLGDGHLRCVAHSRDGTSL